MHRNSTEPNTAYRSGRFEAASRIGALYEVTADVAALPHLMVNSYFIGTPGSADWTLVDAGMPGSGATIWREAERRFGPSARPKQILLTHGHFDHVGALPELARQWGVDVYAHPLELPYLTGRSSYPPPDPTVGGGAMAWSAFLYPRRWKDLSGYVKPLANDGSIPGLPEWRWLHTPGHTPGHVSFFRERDRALIVGDAFVTVRQEAVIAVMTGRPELNGPPAYFTPDWQSARESVQRLAALNPEVVGTGHGVPLRGERMRQELHELANRFDEVARPLAGRYVTQPAVAGVNGTVSLPPFFTKRSSLIYGSAAVAVAGLAALLLRPRR